MSGGGPHEARLLPWSTPEGKPCYLDSDGSGYISRVADTIESVQLGLAGDLLDHADELLAEDEVPPDQLRQTLAQVTEALRNVHRIAQSRGARLPLDPDGYA
ncbi:hypothetical protein [Streptomyces clavuligerus]|uniref:Uncharacterized protein n=1 Tax=Streptomyces clavuligerus TaxID=1901 RepID=B5GQL2_STRCL|nr:hypothetical protein [Streptomyces clavuligerus]ANW20347.1 hypothetical protein BB341_20105 [Streptomyces clavuligerus]AXU14973.1 hypothetical protein D1794_20930 [Streptomyces clavuligerus]EDY48608.1 conserved hypothetical protein [Streptomyces clavuligerus]EFG06707.1 Hypothetical protein SCLAV_1632 [Streptomyces clavuligerus]MBY6305022.1 hypothetical protein [Streptomyces clavuligerus]